MITIIKIIYLKYLHFSMDIHVKTVKVLVQNVMDKYIYALYVEKISYISIITVLTHVQLGKYYILEYKYNDKLFR